jgi:ubiquinone/menaquinone biosynthesis C-methylase UbiE
MNHAEHVSLLKKGVPTKGSVWADLGSGTGAFTLALRDIIGSESEIFSLDKDREALELQRRRVDTLFPHSRIHYVVTDFTEPLHMSNVDGIVMANSLHFIKEKVPLLLRLSSYLKTGGTLIIVEYNTDEGNQWVPYPTSETTLKSILFEAGFNNPHVLHRVPSEFLGEIYAMRVRT